MHVGHFYAPVGTHKIWFEVVTEAGKEDQVVIPPPKVKLPQKFTNPTHSGLSIEVPQSGKTDLKIEVG